MKRILSFGVAMLVFTACNQQVQRVSQQVQYQVDSAPGSCPYFTTNNSGEVVISWVRESSDSNAVLCYATANTAQGFSKPVFVTGSKNVQPHAENRPKIIFKPSGEIIALWGAANPNPKNKYSGIVYYAQSFNNGKTWSQPKKLVTDSSGYDQRYFDVALLPNGEVAIVWLDNRKTTQKEGSALYFATTSGAGGFTGERKIQQQCCPCCRTSLLVDGAGNINIVYRGIINDSIRDMVHTVSTNQGKSFSAPRQIHADNWVISGCPHTGPAMAQGKNGLHFAWYTGGNQQGSFFATSTNNGQTFEGYDGISARGAHPQLAALKNGNIIAVWDETLVKDGALVSKIGVQKRDAKGAKKESYFIASDSLPLTYPVLAETADHNLLVAFCKEKAGKNYVVWQRLPH